MVVLISGLQGSGKTTLQKALIKKWQEHKGHYGVALNFADVLYEMHDYIQNKMESYGIPKIEPKDRALMQLLGTQWGRAVKGEDVWVDVLKGKMKLLKEKQLKIAEKILFVVGDCRFRNEFDGLPTALRVRLVCDAEVRKARVSIWGDQNHLSETDLNQYEIDGKFDLVFDTSGEKTETIVNRILRECGIV